MSGSHLIVSLVAIAAADVPPARSINDHVLAPAEKTKTAGPARVCLHQTSLDLEAGETAYLEYLGFHWGGIRVIGRNGQYFVREGDSWAGPKGEQALVPDGLGRRIVRAGPRTKPTYWIYGQLMNWSGEARPMVRVEGKTLRNGAGRILDRITIHPGDATGCRRRFFYGFDGMAF